jgi:hypothetical protein
MEKPCTEPRLDELLGDPAMQLLMARDGVEETMLRHLLSRVRASRQGLRGGPVPPSGAGSV